MSRRIRWYRLEADSRSSVSPRAIARMMDAQAYTSKKGAGFKLDTAHGDRLEGRYIERVELTEHVEDPFGKLLEFKTVAFRSVGFRVRSNSPEMEIVDPSRALGQFIARLSELFNYAIIIEPVRPRLGAWLAAVERQVGPVNVLAIESSGIALSNAVNARLVIQGVTDVRKTMDSFVGNRVSKLERLTISWRGPNSTVGCDISMSGVKFDKQDESFVYPVVRKALAASIAE